MCPRPVMPSVTAPAWRELPRRRPLETRVAERRVEQRERERRWDGRRSRDRTCDLSLVRAALSRLSYPPVPGFSRTCGPRSILEITPGPAKPCEAKCVAVKRLSHTRSVEQLPHRQRELAECPADLARPSRSRHVLFHVLREFIDLRARSRRRRPFGRRLAGLDLRLAGLDGLVALSGHGPIDDRWWRGDGLRRARRGRRRCRGRRRRRGRLPIGRGVRGPLARVVRSPWSPRR